EPRNWRDDLAGFDRLRVIVNAFARLRFCDEDGTMDMREKRGLAHAPKGMKPWYAHPHRASAGVHIVCGHWSTLGLMLAPNVSMLDSGCLWGGTLTAMQLSDDPGRRRLYQVPSRSAVTPTPGE
ncbi:MAG TPA: bis(5'-nucleosyl)-tetraphosphatase (symmetrical), partial [Casimicrobiaceae bacterium]|nr:bis(5'-nucleosyl)-tetraphosphatase (symmetrical) [Casimicrobiaceae bacterium]